MNNYFDFFRQIKSHILEIIGISNLVIFGITKEQFAFVIGTIGVLVSIVDKVISIIKKLKSKKTEQSDSE